MKLLCILAIGLGSSFLSISSLFADGGGAEWSALSQEARELFRTGKYEQALVVAEKAIESYRQAIKLDPGDAETHSNFGYALFLRGEMDEAIESIRRAIDLDPQLAMVHNNLGLVLAKQGKLDEAIESYRRAIQLAPEFAKAHYNLGTALAMQGKTEAAIESLHRAIQLAPEFAMAHNNLGLALAKQGKTEAAIGSYRRAIELDPKGAEAHTNLSTALLQQGKLDEAIESIRRVIELDPKDAETHSNLGYALFLQGEMDEAIESLHRAIELDPKKLQVIANLANVYAKLEQVDRCGIWTARWGLANGLTAEASLMKQVRAMLRQFKVELPAEKPTDQEIRAYYEANQKTFTASAVYLRTLSLPKDETTRKFADELRDKLVAGGDFAAAAVHSDDLAADDGGDHGWVKWGDLRQDLIDAAFALKAGEISAVIEDDSHYRILNTVERRDGTPTPLEEVREQIVTKLTKEAQAKRIKGWIEKARKGRRG